MNMVDIIEKKKLGEALSTEEISYFIDGFTSGEIPDYQASALMMAICFCGMDDRETADLTLAMKNSGDVITHNFEKFTVDKHSTGGVGDKTTLIVAPIVASLGVILPKLSGRGLGHTGGTLDKLESIPNFSTEMSEEKFKNITKSVGFCVAGQTSGLVPADKKLYALRDVTATVNSLPLISSSIMSKKLSSGADGIVLDVKVGDGAFMKTVEDAEKLALSMISSAKSAGKKCTVILSDMNTPLGFSVGNSLEVIEAISVLSGDSNASSSLVEICTALAGEILFLADFASLDECYSAAKKAMYDGTALSKLREFIVAAGGDDSVFDDFSRFKQPLFSEEIFSCDEGYISDILCENVGKLSVSLGAGRVTKQDKIDMSAGIVFAKSIGDFVKTGEKIATIYSDDKESLQIAKEKLPKYFSFSNEKLERKIIHKIIR